MSFATELRKSLEADPDLKRRGKKILRVLELPRDNDRRKRLVKAWEHHFRSRLGVGLGETVDWSNLGSVGIGIDWLTLLKELLPILLKILALFL